MRRDLDRIDAQPSFEEKETMTAWVLFSILAFLVFGVPLIDEVYRRRARRAASHARLAVHKHVSLIPDGGEENLLVSNEVRPDAKVLEDVA